MNNALKRNVLLILMVTSGIFVQGFENHVPFDLEHQKMLDNIVKKFKAGKSGDYKGYTVKNASYCTSVIKEEKKIMVNHMALSTLSRQELEFLLAKRIYYVSANIDEKSIVKQAYKRAVIHRLGFQLPAIGASCILFASFFTLYLPDANLSDPYTLALCGLSSFIASGIGIVIGGKIADYYDVTTENYISSDCQILIYTMDKVAAETLDCHEAAITVIGKSRYDYTTNKEIKMFPTNKERIERIQSLLKKRCNHIN